MSANTIGYYNKTAEGYDALHSADKTHTRALERSWPLIQLLGTQSILDVGCGTGRALSWYRQKAPSIELYGIEPSERLREIARASISNAEIQDGDGARLPFSPASIDLVVATGIMHHVDDPSSVIADMFRVAKKAVLISDHNNYSSGSNLLRRIRMILTTCGLFEIAVFVKQGFRRQGYSEDDGWWYPYSLFDNHIQISGLSEQMFIIPTRPADTGSAMRNIVFSQSHFAVLAIKGGAGGLG